MHKVISSQKIPIKMWLNDLEQGAINQAKNLANLPFAFKHIVIMPDAHQGYGMPIGGVLAADSVVVPNATGVDIGCGMCSVRTHIPVSEKDSIDFKGLMRLIQSRVPVGFKHHASPKPFTSLPDCTQYDLTDVVSGQLNNAQTQIGTLGGGNHFIEIQEGDDGYIWVMVHSGSRNIGYKTAKHYNDLAKSINRKFHSSVPPSWDLAFFPIDSKEGKAYLEDMRYATDFAFKNREMMMNEVLRSIEESLKSDTPFGHDDIINKPHNFAAWENHFGKNVVVHRKGACRARKGEIGMIPGSQGAYSYIVEGKGDEMSFHSCSHGAGRRMSRAQARRELDLEQEQEHLAEMGVLHTMNEVNNLDEAPSAYKDIEQVMADQTDLVEIKVRLKPLLTVKG